MVSVEPKSKSSLRCDWFDDLQGQAFVRAEQHVAAGLAANVFGYQALEISVDERVTSLLNEAAVISSHRLFYQVDGSLKGALTAELTSLPFSDQTFQLVGLQHMVHWTTALTPVLSEVSRVLAGDGVLMLSCLNQRTLARAAASAPRPWSLRRLTAMLRAHDINPLVVRPICGPSRWQRLLSRAEENPMIPAGLVARWSLGYLLLAKKSTSGYSLIRPRRRTISRAWSPVPTQGLSRKPLTSPRHKAKIIHE